MMPRELSEKLSKNFNQTKFEVLENRLREFDFESWKSDGLKQWIEYKKSTARDFGSSRVGTSYLDEGLIPELEMELDFDGSDSNIYYTNRANALIGLYLITLDEYEGRININNALNMVFKQDSLIRNLDDKQLATLFMDNLKNITKASVTGSSSSYLNKYLKYKNKYLNLKNKLNL